MSKAFDRVCSELESRTGFTPRGGIFRRKAKCPSHDDQNASLSIRDDVDSGLVGVTCFAGCEFDDIVRALGMTKADFREGGRGKKETPAEPIQEKIRDGKEIARYEYTDEAGEPLYYNVRFHPKDFRMAGPDGVIKGLPKNLRRVPYNLPAVLEAIKRGETIYWVEGEKDVHRLAELGVCATTTAGGANSPLVGEWADFFRGASVISIADKDKPGRAYARATGKLLINVAADWRCVEPRLPQPKSDVSDHLDAGYSLDALVSVPMRGVRRTKWTVSALLTTKPEPLKWVLPGIIPEGLSLLVGAPKAGKSWWNLGLMVSMALGRPDEVFGWGAPHTPAPSLYLALEDPHRRLHDRLHKVAGGSLDDLGQAGEIWLDLDPLKDGGRAEIERWLEQNPNARCIMVDVLAKVREQQDTSGGLYQADYEAVGALKEIADEYGIGVLVTHHDRKKTSDDFVDMVSGTKGVTGAADTILYLTRERGSTAGKLKCESRDVEECTYDLDFNRANGRWQIVGKSESGSDSGVGAKQDLVTQIQRIILARGGSSVDEISRILDVDGRMVRRAVTTGQQEGKLAVTDGGLWYVPEGVKEG